MVYNEMHAAITAPSQQWPARIQNYDESKVKEMQYVADTSSNSRRPVRHTLLIHGFCRVLRTMLKRCQYAFLHEKSCLDINNCVQLNSGQLTDHLDIIIHVCNELRAVPELRQQQSIQEAHAAGHQVKVLHWQWGTHHASGDPEHGRYQPLKHAFQQLPASHQACLAVQLAPLG